MNLIPRIINNSLCNKNTIHFPYLALYLELHTRSKISSIRTLQNFIFEFNTEIEYKIVIEQSNITFRTKKKRKSKRSPNI